MIKINFKIKSPRIDYSKSRILISEVPVTVEVKPVIVGVKPDSFLAN